MRMQLLMYKDDIFPFENFYRGVSTGIRVATGPLF